MVLTFRNVDALPTDDVTTWPYEALVATLERGLVPDWQPVFAEIRRSPWGATARRIEDYATYSQERGVASLFSSAIARARENAETRDRAEVASRIRTAIASSGRTSAQFAELVGTSASRLSTYASGKVTPSAAMLIRIERAMSQADVHG